MASGLPALVSFLPLFLSAGYPPRRALDEAVRLTPEPLRSELDRALEPVRRTGRAQEAFENFTARAGIPELDTLLTRLTLLWNQRIPPEILADLDQQFGAVRAVAAARATTALKAQAILLVFSLVLFIAALGAGALLQWIGGALHVVLGI